MKRTIVLVLFFLGYQLLFGALAVGIGYKVPDHKMTIAITAQALADIAIAIHLILAHDVTLNKKTLSPLSWKAVAACLLLIIGMGFWTNFIVELLDLPNLNEDIMIEMMRSPIGMFSIAILAPVVEEMLFRGAIQSRLTAKWKNPWWGIAVASLLFGVIHGNPVQIPFAFITALALGWVYWLTGSLLLPILMHFVNNASAVLLFWCSDQDYNSTMTDIFGTTGAFVVAGAGVVVTLASIIFISKIMQFRKEKTC